jgi:hypothetical protein
LQANLLKSSPPGADYFPEIGQVYAVMSFCLILLLVSIVSYFMYRRWKRVKERD